MAEVTMAVAARSDVGRARTMNEDAFSVADLETGAEVQFDSGAHAFDLSERGVLLALSDGMGGHSAGEVASALVLESLRLAMAAPQGDGAIEHKIEAAVRGANTKVHEAAQTDGKRGMGATLTALAVHAREAYIVEVGDSRAYLLRNGRLRQITRDQSLVQFMVDSGVMTPEDARTSNRKNVILQAMGLGDDVRAAIGRLSLRRRDRFLVCSDGISNSMSDDELRSLLADHDPETACTKMIDLANERGGKDNLTAIVAHVAGLGLDLPAQSESVTSTIEVLQEYQPLPGGPPAVAAPRPAPKLEAAAAPAAPIVAEPAAMAAEPAVVEPPAPAHLARWAIVAAAIVAVTVAAWVAGGLLHK